MKGLCRVWWTDDKVPSSETGCTEVLACGIFGMQCRVESSASPREGWGMRERRWMQDPKTPTLRQDLQNGPESFG